MTVCRPRRGKFTLVSASLYVGVSLGTFLLEIFFCLARLAFSRVIFYADFGIILVRDTNILSARVRLLCTLLVELFHEGMLPPRAEALFVPCLRRKNLVWSMPLVFTGDGIYDMHMLE